MESGEGRRWSVERAADTSSEHRHSRTIQKSHYHRNSKKRRLISKTETETLKLDPTHMPSRPNHFQLTGCSSHTYQKHKKQHRRKSSTTDAFRKWVFSDRDFSSYKDKVVFVSYNILGVENASKHPDLYLNVPSKHLDWDRRKKLICKEIIRYHPSIICFQEVDRFNDLDELLQKDGFRGVYLARTGEACDGCAIFWKNELFSLLHQENIEFQRFGLRDNVAQLCVLKMAHDQLDSSDLRKSKVLPSRSLLVGNTHVLYNPNRGEIKLGQIRLLLEKAHKLSQEWGNIPVVIAGDLNSLPQSAIYQFLASSELDVLRHERRNISGQICPLNPAFRFQNNRTASFRNSVSRPLIYRWSDEELRLATGTEGVTRLRHHLRICSAYHGVPGSCRTRDNYGEPLATTYHSKFMGTVDYIWHTEELVPVRVLEILPIDILRKTGGLPKLGQRSSCSCM
ncbi:carbon catabolite repressor protein 4 homolog 5 isoform X2 [Cornus florida]|uniref:carbon catabolite repressor protein 4 homolog 5 isoform X2 n=1 Tax=Cornus florida TaxID=4283 RepID=UPI0028A0FF52|nr:carbon catabolite repressor protein 4 homolog 5 isoform X2 [Cornus florida]